MKDDSSRSKTGNVSVSYSSDSTKVRLHVLPIVISNNFGEEKVIYTVFDSGSESSLISNEVFNFLSLNGIDVNIQKLTADGRSTN